MLFKRFRAVRTPTLVLRPGEEEPAATLKTTSPPNRTPNEGSESFMSFTAAREA
jgi:hypothetical protein